MDEQTFDQKVYLEARREMILGRDSALTFLGKVREFEELIREEREYLSKWCEKLVAKGDNVSLNFVLKNSKQRREEYEKQLRRFKYLHSIALGHAKENNIDVERLKETDPTLLLGQPKSRTSKMLTFKCPLHHEKTPSFVWYKKTKSFYCFGCQEGGDIITLYQKMNSCDFVTACKELQKL